MKNIALILLLIIAGVASWQYVVNKRERVSANDAYSELQKKLSDTLKDYNEFIGFANSMINDAAAHAADARQTAKESQHELNRERLRVKSLLSLLDSAEKETPDSTWVQVSPNYKLGCDSLRGAYGSLITLVDQYEHDNQAHVDALNYETTIRDSALQKERAFSASFRQQLADCLTIGKAQQQKYKPRSQVYAGMAAWGNAITPLGGGEINLGLKTKSDQFYEIKGAYINGWWFGIGTKFLISLK